MFLKVIEKHLFTFSCFPFHTSNSNSQNQQLHAFHSAFQRCNKVCNICFRLWLDTSGPHFITYTSILFIKPETIYNVAMCQAQLCESYVMPSYIRMHFLVCKAALFLAALTYFLLPGEKIVATETNVLD